MIFQVSWTAALANILKYILGCLVFGAVAFSAPCEGICGSPSQPGSAQVCFAGGTKSGSICLSPRKPLVEELTDQYQYGDPAHDTTFPPKANPQLYRVPQKFLDLKVLDPKLPLTVSLLVSDVLNTVRYPFGLFSPLVTEKLESFAGQTPQGLKITSGYRSPGYNATLPGAAKWSRHLYGDAVDIAATQKEIPLIEKLCTQAGASYTQLYVDHVHCDWRLHPLPDAYFEGARRQTPVQTPEDLKADLSEIAQVDVFWGERTALGQEVLLRATSGLQEDGGQILSRWAWHSTDGKKHRRLASELQLVLPQGIHSIYVEVGGSLPKSLELLVE